MEKINILIAGDIDLSNLDIFPEKNFNIIINPGIENQTILDSSDQFDCMIVRSTRMIDRHFLDKCNMKVIATCSRGCDNIDAEYARKKNIVIIKAIDGNSISTAEHTIGLILNIFKQINYSDYLVRSNQFGINNFQRNELNGKTIGIIGIGKVGSKVAKLAKSFGMELLINDIDKKLKFKYKIYKFVNINYLLKNSDIVTLHIPLNKDNKKFISKRKIDLIRETSVLINTSRGGVIDEEYLIESLKRKKIKFAGLDVFNNEPAINKKFSSLKNVLMTNHIAGKTEESKYKIAEEIIRQIKKYFKN